jgi:O-antigen/teichoic acid export membrane protein
MSGAPPPDSTHDKTAVSRGAATAFLGHTGALIEAVAVLVFAKLYGPTGYGFFILMWAYAQLLTILAAFGMTVALQRFIPAQRDELQVHRVLRNALIFTTLSSLAIALALVALAPWLAGAINAGEMSDAQVIQVITLYAWSIPLWCWIEVTTSAIRARRVFGPEIRIRVFYEQSVRLIAGVAFFFLGFTVFGLFAAHLFSLTLAAMLTFRLIARYYRLDLLFRRDRQAGKMMRDMIHFSASMVIPQASVKFHSNLPILFLNYLLPGTTGVVAGGAYAVARKIVSVLRSFRESFEYVMAPMASAKSGAAEIPSLREIYAFSTRIICATIIPAAAVVIMFGGDLLAFSNPAYQSASGVIIVLALGRCFEAVSGPSDAIIAMIGRYRLPLANAVAAGLTTAVLSGVLVPWMGATGGAIAAAIGLNVASTAALLEVYVLHHMQPFDRHFLRPALTALALAGGFALLVWGAGHYGFAAKLAAGGAGLLIVPFLLLRYGLSEQDIAAVLTKPRHRQLFRPRRSAGAK